MVFLSDTTHQHKASDSVHPLLYYPTIPQPSRPDECSSSATVSLYTRFTLCYAFCARRLHRHYEHRHFDTVIRHQCTASATYNERHEAAAKPSSRSDLGTNPSDDPFQWFSAAYIRFVKYIQTHRTGSGSVFPQFFFFYFYFNKVKRNNKLTKRLSSRIV